MIRSLVVILAATMLVGATCRPADVPEPLPPFDAGGGSCCARACTNLRGWTCPEGAPSETGESCEDLCERAERAGIPLASCCIAAQIELSAAKRCRSGTGGATLRCRD